MEEFLCQYEVEKYHCHGFWRKIREGFLSNNLAELISGRLTVRRAHDSWKTDLYSLTSEYLIQYQVSFTQNQSKENPYKSSPVSWKRVEAFTEGEADQVKFGFRLVRGDNAQDFYVSSPRELEVWLEALSQVAVMTDFSNDFALEREVGTGNYATVYVGRQLTRGKIVAVKCLAKNQFGENARNLTALITEVNIMKRLRHPHLLRLLHRYEDDEKLYLILEYAGGGDLFHWLHLNGRFSEAKAAAFMKELLDTLAYLHRNGVIHRDLKPENILLMSGSNELDFKIADFGLAAECSSDSDLSQRCGSPGYVAPEILGKLTYNTKVDLFSAGVILYIL